MQNEIQSPERSGATTILRSDKGAETVRSQTHTNVLLCHSARFVSGHLPSSAMSHVIESDLNEIL